MTIQEVGTFRQYSGKNVRKDRLEMILRAAKICEEYEAKGYTLTVRQLYYQHVARGLIPNEPGEYDKLAGLVADGRMMGIISWTAIEDRGRFLRGWETSDNPDHAIVKMAQEYKRDLWHDQLVRPEVWVEKDALAGVVGDICNRLRVDFFPCKGYASLSELWRAARRFVGRLSKGQRPMVLYLGDHDPSGMQMTENIAGRLATFTGTPIQVIRLALNKDQIEEVNPPPNPAKKTDSRYAAYEAEHGDLSWELDALEPEYVHNLIDKAVEKLRDEKQWEAALADEVKDREYLLGLAEREDAA